MNSSSPTNRSIDPYTLTAVADLQKNAGDSSRRLRAILFMATNGEQRHIWTAANLGTFVADFALLVDAEVAFQLYQSLCKGEKVTFPGQYDLKTLKDLLGG